MSLLVETRTVPTRYAYFQGCAARQSCPELNQATLLVAKHLGWELTHARERSLHGRT